MKLNWGLVVALFYAGYYALMDQPAGLAAAGGVLLAQYTASKFSKTKGSTRNALILHVAAWIAQFIGHGAFEGRAPALLDNLAQSLLMAPLFVVLEGFFGFGYKPELHNKYV